MFYDGAAPDERAGGRLALSRAREDRSETSSDDRERECPTVFVTRIRRTAAAAPLSWPDGNPYEKYASRRPRRPGHARSGCDDRRPTALVSGHFAVVLRDDTVSTDGRPSVHVVRGIRSWASHGLDFSTWQTVVENSCRDSASICESKISLIKRKKNRNRFDLTWSDR